MNKKISPLTDMSADKQAAEILAKTVIVQGQQDTSNMWESTQRNIATAWTLGSLIVLVAQGLGYSGAAFPDLLVVLTTVIVQSYFQRTNTHRIGGVAGNKPTDER